MATRAANPAVYGPQKKQEALNREQPSNRLRPCTVERRMAACGLSCAARGKKGTTVTADVTARPGDRLSRNSTAPASNQRWVAGITQIATSTGVVYVAFLLDPYSSTRRRVADAEQSAHRPALYALEQGLWQRQRTSAKSPAGPRSDRGLQCLAIRHNERLTEAGAVALSSPRGNFYDKAAEPLNGLHKTKLLRRRGLRPSRTSRHQTRKGSTDTTTTRCTPGSGNPASTSLRRTPREERPMLGTGARQRLARRLTEAGSRWAGSTYRPLG